VNARARLTSLVGGLAASPILGDTAFAFDLMVVDEMRKMREQDKTKRKQLRLWWSAAFAASLLIALPASAASNAPGEQALINKFALNAYCSEAQSNSALLADGSISYKQVADLASKLALAEHPNVYRDSAGWKAKIVALLDQYGDDPMIELCTDDDLTYNGPPELAVR
jgi:hypothetical protein